jgi:hypothetical protein
MQEGQRRHNYGVMMHEGCILPMKRIAPYESLNILLNVLSDAKLVRVRIEV